MFNIYELDNEIIKEQYMSKKDLNITTAKQKRNSLIWCLIMVGFSFLSGILKNKDAYQVVIWLVVMLVSAILINIIYKTVFEKEHFIIYKTIFFINKLAKLMIFVLTFEQSYEFIIVGLEGSYSNVNLIRFAEILATKQGLTDVWNILLSDLVQGITKVVGLIGFIPTLLFFIWYYVMYIPPLCLITFIRYIKRDPLIYYSYEEESDNKVIRYTHRITQTGIDEKIKRRKTLHIIGVFFVSVCLVLLTLLLFM